MNNECLLNPQNESEIINLRTQQEQRTQSCALPKSDSYFLNSFKSQIYQILRSNSDFSFELGDLALAQVPSHIPGDFAIQIKNLMRDMKQFMAVQQSQLINILQQHQVELGLTSVSAQGPFINVELNINPLADKVLSAVSGLGENYGKSDFAFGSNVLVDYSSPNMGKALHAGHIGTTFLGQVLSNIYSAVGSTVFRINHLGDWGTPVGLVKVAEEEFAGLPEIEVLRNKASDYYSALYSKISLAQKEDTSLRERAQIFFSSLEKGEPKAKEFWNRVRQESIAEFEKVYADIGINFNAYLGESFYEPYLKDALSDVVSSGLAKSDGQAVVVDYESEKLGTVLIAKSDGATTYMARDLAAVKKRSELFGLSKAVYVVGTEQNLHFRQLFKIAETLNYCKPAACVHVPIGLLTKNGKKISSRSGGALAFDELYQDVYQKCLETTKGSLVDVSVEEIEKVAKQIANAALYFAIVSTTPGKNSEFDLEKITNTKGKSGPSLQYTCVRANSILNKLGHATKSIDQCNKDLMAQILMPFKSLILKMTGLNEVLENCSRGNTAHLLTNYLDELSAEFTEFIHAVRIKDAAQEEREIYLNLVNSLLTVLKAGLTILNIEVPERM